MHLTASCLLSRQTVRFSAATRFVQEKAFHADLSQLLGRGNWLVLLYSVSEGRAFTVSLSLFPIALAQTHS